MNMLECRTRGNASPQGKPRVYFTCHPEDFERYFDKICEDIFRTHDCAIYYAKDMAGALSEETREVDLERMNLFVIPVTFRLLHTGNRTMGEDFPFAQGKHIPVLPIMMEPGLDQFYSQEDKFGELQYLNSYSHDATEISYEDKLKRYLESVLVSDELANRIRAAFDAYIFLSYRKKDRKYANELMRLIHSNPFCRDIAIWYDEFLTPGENFSETIKEALNRSDLFTLLVTPNLVNEPNYVQSKEYPEAHRAGKSILPVEMEETDRENLERKFADLPECVDVREKELFRTRLQETVSRIAVQENDDDPTHNYLIGLAYFEGIDVEVDRERGLKLITSAAEAELPEAMHRLRSMYADGVGVEVNYQESLKWGQRLVDYYTHVCGENNLDTIIAMNHVGFIYAKMGEFKKSIELSEKVYELGLKVLGEEHIETITALNNLAIAYGELGEYKKALRFQEMAYSLWRKAWGDEHPDTLIAMNNLACAYRELGEFKKALEIQKEVYMLQCKIFGEEHPHTITSLSNLAISHLKLGDSKKAIELNIKAYELSCRVMGEKHCDTLTMLGNLAFEYGEIGEHFKALELKKRAYSQLRKALGEEHINTLTALNNLAYSYGEIGEYNIAMKLQEKALALFRAVYGDNHPNTIIVQGCLAGSYWKLGKIKEAKELYEEVYSLRCKVLGEEHSDTLAAMRKLALTYWKLEEYSKELELEKKLYALQCKLLGAHEERTLRTLCDMADTYSRIGDEEKTLELCDKIADSGTALTPRLIVMTAELYKKHNKPERAAALIAGLSQ